MSVLRDIGRGALLSAMILLTPAALLLAALAETTRGAAVGGLAIALVAAGVFAYAGQRRPTVALACVVLAGGVALTLLVPGPEARGPIHSTPLPFAPSQVVPEVDQVKLGILLSPHLDRYIDAAQAERVAKLVLPLYRTLGTDARRSALTLGYAEIFGASSESGHMYWSAPEGSAGGPALVFLHGSAGNWLAYPAILHQLGVILVCPTTGFGLYRDPEATARTVAAARRFAIETLGADPERIFLAALSQGGVGATQVAQRGRDFRGVALISAVVDRAAVDGWEGPDVLVLHGERDRRIDRAYTAATVAAFETSTATITARYFPEQDHFLLFAQPDEVLGTLRDWMGAHR